MKRIRISRKKKITLVVILVLLGIITGAGYMVMKVMTGPAVGTVVQTMEPTIRKQEVEQKQIDTAQISFALPITYIEQNIRSQPNPNNLESRTYISSGMTSKVLTMLVSKLPSGRLEDDPSYLVRAQDKVKYQMRELVLKNEKVTVFTMQDTQQLQQVAFWPHAGKLLSFTLSGVATDMETAKAEFQAMVETLAWR